VGALLWTRCLLQYHQKPEAGKKDFFVDVLMTGSALGAYSNCLVVPGEEPSHVSTSFILGALGERLVVAFSVASFLQLEHSLETVQENWMTYI
jgi:hypothetical protein